MHANPEKKESKAKKDKVRIFCQDQINKLELNGKVEKRDKKNVAKNLVKLFLAWIEKKKIDKGPFSFKEV